MNIQANWVQGQVIVEIEREMCNTTGELLASDVFRRVVSKFVDQIRRKESHLVKLIPEEERPGGSGDRAVVELLVRLLQALAERPLARVKEQIPEGEYILSEPGLLHEFVEELYNFWRRFDRYLVCRSEQGVKGFDDRPYRTFNRTVEQLHHLVRAAYRDICENITDTHPRIYRQVPAGCQVGLIATAKAWPIPGEPYDILKDVPFIRQIMIHPPMIIDPPMNRRKGQFHKVAENPLTGMEFDPAMWLCYPARVGPLLVFVYVHRRFIGLGSALANLFELATEEEISNGPDAIYIFGAPKAALQRFAPWETVFHDDDRQDLLVGAVPCEEKFGYFGYLKKMILTLHNIVIMKKYRRMPFHGAMVRIVMKSGRAANLIIIGDTATGKSESLEAFRTLADEHISEMQVIADDMGSLELDGEGRLRGYGTEVGAFVRLDDLQPGFAFNQIDRAIIMSPQKVNARAVLPVTSLEHLLYGYEVDFLLYANNYEEVDADHPVIERFSNVNSAWEIFREGCAMGKGTTATSGLTRNYFANVFGPVQYQDLHDKLAKKVFRGAFDAGVFVGQLRTRLAIPGYERKGPEAVARGLLSLIGGEESWRGEALRCRAGCIAASVARCLAEKRIFHPLPRKTGKKTIRAAGDEEVYRVGDMLVKLYELPEYRDELKALAQEGIRIRRPLAPEMHRVIEWVRENFNEGWASETARTFANSPVSSFIAVQDNRILGFVCYDTTCRDYLGPMGVREDMRGKGIGKVLLLRCLDAMWEAGYAYAVIGGAGPTDFYSRVAGAIPIPDSEPGVYRGMLR